MKGTRVDSCKKVDINKHFSERKGNLTVVENGKEVPFDVKRIYYLYDIPAGEQRGGHAHKDLHQLIVSVSGSFKVILNDGIEKKEVILNRPYEGLYICPGVWRDLEDFSASSVCLVLASEKYDEADYIRDYKQFIEYKTL